MAMLPKRLGFVLPAVRRVSTGIYGRADIVATNSRAYIDCFESVHRLRREDCRYVPQYAEDSYLEMDLDAQPSDKTRFMGDGQHRQAAAPRGAHGGRRPP